MSQAQKNRWLDYTRIIDDSGMGRWVKEEDALRLVDKLESQLAETQAKLDLAVEALTFAAQENASKRESCFMAREALAKIKGEP